MRESESFVGHCENLDLRSGKMKRLEFCVKSDIYDLPLKQIMMAIY